MGLLHNFHFQLQWVHLRRSLLQNLIVIHHLNYNKVYQLLILNYD